MLATVSSEPTFLWLIEGLRRNTKYTFDFTVGDWSITVRNHLDVAEKIFNLSTSGRIQPLRLKKAGGKIIIYDSDIMINRRWLSIWKHS